jgi:hypothetical protein
VALSVELTGTVAGASGRRLACGPGGRWAVAERRLVTIDGGATFTAPRPIEGALRFSGDLLLAGTERLDLAAGGFEALPDPRPAVAAGASELQVIAAAWDAAGDELVVSAERPSGQRPPGPRAWLTLMAGRERRALRPLWSGISEAPRTVAIEGGTIAAEVEARARLWRGEEELAPPAGPVSGLALGDGGDLLALSDYDGGVSVWRGPGFKEGERVGDAARTAPAAAADAPVLAWGRADEVVVWADGEIATLAVAGALALAVDAAGEWLVALDDAGKLSRATIRQRR